MATRKLDISTLPANNKLKTNNNDAYNTKLSGPIVVKPRGGGLANTIRDVGNGLFTDVILPALKDIMRDFLTTGADMLLYGGSVDRGRYRGRGAPRRYDTYYEERRSPQRDRGRSYGRPTEITSFVLDDLYFAYREDAELILGLLLERLAEYKWVTVGDLYNLAGVESNFTHERYGWGEDSLANVRIIPSADGYLIDLPRPSYLKN